MKLILYLLMFLLSSLLLYGQSLDKEVKVDTMIYSIRKCKNCPILMDTVIYKRLKCGLYLGSNGTLGYKTEEVYSEDKESRTRYITWLYGADKSDSINGGLMQMEYVIDTTNFQFLNFYYWADKNQVFGFNPMSDGGTVYLHKKANRKSFIVLGNDGYAKDKTHVYYRGEIINGADIKTFKSIKHGKIPELARDKLYFYASGTRMTEEEVREMKLDIYRK